MDYDINEADLTYLELTAKHAPQELGKSADQAKTILLLIEYYHGTVAVQEQVEDLQRELEQANDELADMQWRIDELEGELEDEKMLCDELKAQLEEVA